MSKDFVFVAGDIGAARMQAPVIRRLRAMGHRADIIADAGGMAASIFREQGLRHNAVEDLTFLPELLEGHDLAVIGTSASAQRLEWAVWNDRGGRKVLVSDGYFNHGLAPWRDVREGPWLAIDAGHARAIRQRRPGIPRTAVRIVGQPAFDGALALEPRKREIRARHRSALGFTDADAVHLWWSHGMPRVIEEDLRFLGEVLAHPQAERPVLIPRLHPKLDAIRPGLSDEMKRRVREMANATGFRVIGAGGIANEELSLAVDVALSVTCTEDIKSTLIGGPPVVHFMGPEARAWFEEDLGLRPPYLPDVAAGTAVAALTPADVPQAVARALQREPLRAVETDASRPATERVAEALLDLAS